MSRSVASPARRPAVPASRARRGAAAEPLHLVAIGGGSGLATLLRGLKREVSSGELASLTAIVTVTDDGGSSGRLRRDFAVLPPGDIRNCLAALADDEALLTRLFQYRFASGEGLAGHSFGNLLLTALAGMAGDFYQAILAAERILSVRGRILPSTVHDVQLRARGKSGTWYEGETAVGRSGERLQRVELVPKSVPAFPDAVAALQAADLIVLGPGSLYTSVLPNLLIRGLATALARSRAPVVLPMNLMTQPGETDGMDAHDHLRALERHAGEGLVDVVLAHDGGIPKARLAQYRASGARPVAVDAKRLARHGAELVTADLLAPEGLIRHDPTRLAAAVLEAGAAWRRRRRQAAR